MFSEIQQRKLRYLSEHPKYGCSLKEALYNWNNGFGIARCKFGIKFSYDEIDGIEKRIFTTDNDYCGCLIGAALLNKTIVINYKSNEVSLYSFAMSTIFEISQEDYNMLIIGFDHKYETVLSDFERNKNEAFLFGKLVADIIFDHVV